MKVTPETRTVAASKPLADHLANFKAALLTKGTTEQHARQTVTRAQAVIEGCGFAYWSDLAPSRVQRYLADLRTGEKPVSIQTTNFYLQAVKQFCKWMVRETRTSESPLDHLQGQNVRTDRRHDRRALSVEELRRLLAAAEQGPAYSGLGALT